MEQYSNSATRQLVSFGGGLGRRIKASVLALADDLAGRAREPSGATTMIVASDAGTEVHVGGRRGTRRLAARVGSTPEEIAAGLKRTLRRRARRDVLLRIGEGRAVVKPIELPAAALEVLPAVVRNKVEGLAPWPLPEVLWGYRLLDRPKAGRIDVEVGVVSRKTADTLLAAVRAANVKVAYVDIAASSQAADGIAVDFLGEGRVKRARRMLGAVMSAAGLAALGVSAYGLNLAVGAQLELAQVERRGGELRQLLLGRAADGQGGGRLAAANQLYERKRDSLPAVKVLNSLSRLVPDGTWLSGIDYTGGTVTITGKGTEIGRVIESLETSEVFSGVNFASATQRDASLNADIFSISAALERKGEAQ
jgi:general secretion pathway protein L